MAATETQLAILTQGDDAVGGREWSSLRSGPYGVVAGATGRQRALGDAQPRLDELGSGPQLASRTGLEVRPERGLAFSHQGGEVELAEVFPPTTLEAYERDIYEEPGPEIREDN